MGSDSRKPDYNLWVANDNSKGKAGAAWINEDKSISIVLDPFTVIRGRGHGGSLTVMLFPYGGYEERKKAKEDAHTKKGKFDDAEDDIPF